MDPTAMDQLKALLKPELLVYAAACVGVFQIIWRVFQWAAVLPSIPKWSVPLAMVPTAFALALRESQIHPFVGTTRMLADDWAVQGMLLLAVMLGGWLAGYIAFNDSATSGEGASGAIRRTVAPLTVIGAMLLSFALSTAASAEEPASVLRWDPKRVSVGVTGSGAIHGVEDGRPIGSSFRLDAYGNWNLSTHLNAFVGVDQDFADELTNWKAGGSGQLVGTDDSDNFSLFIGAYYVKRTGDGAAAFQFRESWEAYIQGAQVVARSKGGRKWLALVGGARFDPNNNVPTGLLGLRVQGLGGSKR